MVDKFKDKFDRLAEVMGVANAQKNMVEILEKALDIAIEKKDPKKKLERRRKRQGGATGKSRSDEVTEKDEPAKSRYVASEVRGRVHERDGYQCVYVGLDGRRCTARVALQFDHKKPFGIFRSNDEADLRLLYPLCRYRHKAHYADYVIMPRRGRTGGEKARWARVAHARHKMQRGIIAGIRGRQSSRPRAQSLTPGASH